MKRIGNCVFNSMWISRCFGKTSLENIKAMPVICSGSTMGSALAMRTYIPTMLRSMDTVQCWKRGIESDQGYQNFLFYNGHFNTPEGNATLFLQGEDMVNTIGAMNGFRYAIFSFLFLVKLIFLLPLISPTFVCFCWHVIITAEFLRSKLVHWTAFGKSETKRGIFSTTMGNDHFVFISGIVGIKIWGSL